MISSNTRLYPYPDIAKWWSDVDSTFKLSSKEIDDLVLSLDKIQQKEKESCVDYLMRFLSKVTELRLAGKHLSDEEQGRKCLKGLFSKFRKSVFQSFSVHNLVVDIQHFRHICQLEDEYAHDSADAFDKETTTLQANAVSESPKQKRKRNRKNKYGPPASTDSNPTANMVSSQVPAQTTPITPVNTGFPNKNSNGDRDRSSSAHRNKKFKGRPDNVISREVRVDNKTDDKHQDNRGRQDFHRSVSRDRDSGRNDTSRSSK